MRHERVLTRYHGRYGDRVATAVHCYAVVAEGVMPDPTVGGVPPGLFEFAHRHAHVLRRVIAVRAPCNIPLIWTLFPWCDDGVLAVFGVEPPLLRLCLWLRVRLSVMPSFVFSRCQPKQRWLQTQAALAANPTNI
jgi:hypothetical protein